MRELRMALPELALIGATRGMLGAGIGLLVAGKFGSDRRKVIGIVLAALGALSTIPLALMVHKRSK